VGVTDYSSLYLFHAHPPACLSPSHTSPSMPATRKMAARSGSRSFVFMNSAAARGSPLLRLKSCSKEGEREMGGGRHLFLYESDGLVVEHPPQSGEGEEASEVGQT
jgi:hypothetical protein